MMDLFSLEFFSALMAVIIIDLVLAGDNAVIIALAARNLPKEYQKKAIVWGSIGAILIRSICTILFVWLLKIPGLLLCGGVILIWIAYKLLTEKSNHDINPSNSLFSAIRTIIIADTMMGLDNVLAVAGASHGNYIIVVLGLLISIPIIILGSKLILNSLEKYRFIIFIGGAVLAWTASKMIVQEPFLKSYFLNSFIKYSFEVLIIAVVITASMLSNHICDKQEKAKQQAKAQQKVSVTNSNFAD
jgi:YjbE family integral membrane protein